MRSIRFRTLGCYPLTGAGERGYTLEAVIQEMLLTTTANARAARSTMTRRREHGEEEAGGYLMACFAVPGIPALPGALALFPWRQAHDLLSPRRADRVRHFRLSCAAPEQAAAAASPAAA